MSRRLAAYHTLARRADAALETVHGTVDCPCCGDPVGVRVEGASDVDITDPCSDGCHKKSYYNHDEIQRDAIDMAASERADYLDHLLECGE